MSRDTIPPGTLCLMILKTLVRGDPSFRPVAMAIAPGGAVYITDWADVAYPVHHKGRILRTSQAPPEAVPRGRPPTAICQHTSARTGETAGSVA